MPVETQVSRSQHLQQAAASKASSHESGHVDPRKMRRIIAEDPEWNLETVPPLTELCIRHVIINFSDRPLLNELLPHHRQQVLGRLPCTLPLQVTAPLIEEEDYWRKCCLSRWPLCRAKDYGPSWKRMYFEKHLQELVETFVPKHSDEKELIRMLALSSPFVHCLCINQLLPPPRELLDPDDDDGDGLSEFEERKSSRDHLNLGPLLQQLCLLQELQISYGVKDCGMNFEWDLFEFTKMDCQLLAQAVKNAHHLRVLRLHRSKVGDERARMLVVYLMDHPGLQVLDLSHNELGDGAGRALGKLLNGHCHLHNLELANNTIGALGGSSIGHALQNNSTLLRLNLRLNRLGDEGIQPVLKSLVKNTSLKELNISSNDFGESSAILLSEMLVANTTLHQLNISCNKLGEVGGKLMQEGIEENLALTDLDLRLTEIAPESEYAIHQHITKNQERRRLDKRSNFS